MVKVSNVLFVLFLIGFTTSKQLQGQIATLSLKDSKQKIEELINEMIPKETREALQKEGLLDKNFTNEVFSTVIEDMTNDGLLSQAKQQQKIQEKKQTSKADLKEAKELIEYVLSDNITEHSKEQDKNGETGIRNKYKMTIRKPVLVKEEEEYPEEPEDLPSDDKEEQIVSQPENTTNTTQDIEIEQPLEPEQNKTQEQLQKEEQPELPSQPQSPIEQEPQIQEESNTTEIDDQEDSEVEVVDEPEFKPLFPKGLVKNIYNKFLNDVKESGLACKKKNCQKP